MSVLLAMKYMGGVDIYQSSQRDFFANKRTHCSQIASNPNNGEWFTITLKILLHEFHLSS